MDKSKSVSSSSKNTFSTPAKSNEPKTSIGEPECNTGANGVGLSYTTPEQEKKLRSYSLDETPTKSGGSASNNMASKNDREALERQIRNQRLEFDERDIAEAAARSARANRTNGTSNSNSASYVRYSHNRTRYGATGSSSGSPGLAHSITSNTSNGMGSYMRAVSMGNQSREDLTASTERADRTSPHANNNMRVVSSLEGLLQNHTNTRITSIEQLEEIMFMEVNQICMYDS